MADNKLELVVEVATSAANASIKGLNDGLAWFEQVAVRASTNASQGFGKFELEAARMMKSFASNVKQFISDPLGAAGMAVEGLLNKMGMLGVGLAAVVGAFGAVMAAGNAAAHSLGEYAISMENAAIRTGLNITQASQLNIAMKMAGGEIGDVETAMKMLSKGMSENTEKGKESRAQLKAWGISARSDTLTVLTEIGSKLGAMTNHWEMEAAAQTVMGKSALTLLPMLLQMGENMERVKAAGLGLTDESSKEMKALGQEAALTDAKLASVKKTYFDRPLAAVWKVVIDWAWAKAPVPGSGNPRDFGMDSIFYRQVGHSHLNSELRPAVAGDAGANAQFASDAASYAQRSGPKIDSAGSDASAKLAANIEKEIVGLYIQRLSAGQQIFAQGQERLAQLREEGQLTAKVASLANLKTRMQWQNYSNGLIPGIDKTPFEGSTMPGSVDLLSSLPAVANTADVDPAILDKNAKSARDFALKGAEMGAKGGGTDAQLALLARRKELGVDSLTLAQEQAQVQIDAETKLAQMQQDRLTALKDGFNQVFDSLMSGGKGLMQTLMNLFKAAAITPVRNAFSSAFASALAPAPGGGSASGGGLGSLMQLFRGTASGGGMAAGQATGGAGTPMGGGITGSPFDWASRDDGMGGGDDYRQYIDSPTGATYGGGAMAIGGMGASGMSYGTGSGAASGSSMGGLGQMGGMASSVGNLFKGGGGLSGLWSRASGQSYGTAGADGQPGVDMGGSGAPSSGVGGIAGGAMMMGGMMLGMDGLKRGGGIGMLEDTGAGALIGGKYGGWLGTGIGAAVGLGVGALRWAFGGKSPEQKMKDAVKDAYGLKIDTNYAQSLVKEAGGMDARVFIQQDKIRQEIMLYAQMTKSSVSGGSSNLYSDTVARGVNLTESGGSLYQSATYSNGGAYGYQSTLASMGGFQTLTPNVTVVANMDGRATTNFLGGAAVRATSQSQGRTGLASNLLSPAMGTI